MLRPLRNHSAGRHPDLIVGFQASDDAGVYRIAPDRALVQTVDFFTPIVDDPYDWGRIAAANALSDIYAMGATPLTALQMIGWPRDELDFNLAGEVVRGGADVMASAGCTIVGGHSIDDAEPKYGFAVTGLIHTESVITNAGGRPGDHLVITKPIGTGIIASAIKRGNCPTEIMSAAIEVMVTLNRDSAVAMSSVGVHAATDVTGFGLLGHLSEINSASGVGAMIIGEEVPVLDGAWSLLDAGMYPGGSQRNIDAVSDLIDGVPDRRMLAMLCDAQTSGGLLIAVAPERVQQLLHELKGRGREIGRLVAGDRIEVR